MQHCLSTVVTIDERNVHSAFSEQGCCTDAWKLEDVHMWGKLRESQNVAFKLLPKCALLDA